MPLDVYPQFSELTEVGGFWAGRKYPGTEELIKTPFAFATLPITQSYLVAAKDLVAAGWKNLGNRYNALHGPNYISLWWYELDRKPQEAVVNGSSPYDYYSNRKGLYKAARYASACCGLLLSDCADLDSLYAAVKSEYLQIIRLPLAELNDAKLSADWRVVGTNNSHCFLVNTQSGNYKAPEESSPLQLLLQPTAFTLPTAKKKSTSKETPIESSPLTPAPRRRKATLARLKSV